LRRTLVLNVVGLTQDLLRFAPNLTKLAKQGGCRSIQPVLPAVTCSVQSTYLTGKLPCEHGIVGNGWYFRDLASVKLWQQSNLLVVGEKLWESAKKIDPTFTVAKLFWWYNMYSSADISVTPRPCYLADGRKIPDIYTNPPELREKLQKKFGSFPLFHFWGPMADIVSSKWIAKCAQYIEENCCPTLSLVYLPHLDYDLQRLGPHHPDITNAVAEVDFLCGKLITMAQQKGHAVVALSEYGVSSVVGAIGINRALRKAGFLFFREERGREMLDTGASLAFAVADHQIAHVYVKDPSNILMVKVLVEKLKGIAYVLDTQGKTKAGLSHNNAGDLVAVALADYWFSYGWWLDNEKAPDYARTVDIHRKPGYDPLELFINPKIVCPKLKIASKMVRKAFGLRTLMDFIPLDESLVKGSHGHALADPSKGAIFITTEAGLLPSSEIPAVAIKSLLLSHVFPRRLSENRDRSEKFPF